MPIKALLFFFLLFTGCAKKTYLADVTSRNYRIEKGSYTNDEEVSDIIAPYKEKLDKVMNEVIGYNTQEMTKGKPNSPLTNWFADAMLEEVNAQKGLNADFAIQNYGGVRVNSMAKGDITIRTIYELMPFDNSVYILTMKGDVVQKLFDKIANSEGWPISKSVQFTMEFGKAVKIKINGKSLEPDAEYKAVIPDYVANGGDNTSFLNECQKFPTQLLVRDLLINYVKRKTSLGQEISADLTPRILEAGNE